MPIPWHFLEKNIRRHLIQISFVVFNASSISQGRGSHDQHTEVSPEKNKNHNFKPP